MKFFIFNIAVTAALLYLLIGEGQMPNLDHVMSRTEKATTQVASAIDGIVAPERQEQPTLRQPSAPQPPRVVMPAKPTPILKKKNPDSKTSVVTSTLDPKPRPDAPSQMVTAIKTTPVPLPPAQTVAQRQVKQIPVPTISDSLEAAPPMAASKSSAFFEPATPKFMTPADRRRELSKLARSAERLFIDRLAE
jgi:hypothetical protein